MNLTFFSHFQHLHLPIKINIPTMKRLTAKCTYGIKSHGEKSLRQNDPQAKCPYGEVSLRRNVSRRNVQRRKVQDPVSTSNLVYLSIVIAINNMIFFKYDKRWAENHHAFTCQTPQNYQQIECYTKTNKNQILKSSAIAANKKTAI